MFFNKFILKLTRDLVEVSTYKVPLYYFPFTVSIFYAPRETIILITSIWLYNSLIENGKKKSDDDDESDKESINGQVFTTLQDENIDEDEISSINLENEINENTFYNLSDDEKVNEGKLDEEISDDGKVNEGKLDEEISDYEKLDEDIADEEIDEEISVQENLNENIADEEITVQENLNESKLDEEISTEENKSQDSYELDTIEDSLSDDQEDTERENKYLMFLSYIFGVKPKFD